MVHLPILKSLKRSLCRVNPLTSARMFNKEDEIDYETRAVAFIDILGWTAAVEASASNSEQRMRIHNAVWALGAKAKKDVEDDTPDHPSRDRASQFSDSVIISIPFMQPLDLIRLIRQIASYQMSMIMSGFTLRGGITVGSMFHEGPLAFGPALNAAYHLERRQACFPRVLIDSSLNRYIEAAARKFPTHWPFVRINSDGYYFPDYLTTLAMSEAASAQINRMIALRLEEFTGDSRTFPKYQRLHDKWEEAKQDSGWRKAVSDKLREDFWKRKRES